MLDNDYDYDYNNDYDYGCGYYYYYYYIVFRLITLNWPPKLSRSQENEKSKFNSEWLQKMWNSRARKTRTIFKK